MNRFFRWCSWELKNELIACGYFCVMLFCYGIVELIYGNKEVNVVVIFEMFLLNYIISTIQKIVLDSDKDYEKRSYYLRAIGLTVVSFLFVVFSCKFFGWFSNRSIYAELFLYLCMVSAYLFIWIMMWLMKKYDTKQLNEQLMEFKQRNQE